MFGVHGVGGVVGSLLTGVFADPVVSGARGDVLTQALGVAAVLVYGLVGTALCLWITRLVVGLRVDAQSELTGLDIAQQRERLGH